MTNTLIDVKTEEIVKKIPIVKGDNKDSKNLDEEIEMIGKKFKLEHMTQDDIKASLIGEPFILPPELIRCRLRDSGPIILRIIEDAIYRL